MDSTPDIDTQGRPDLLNHARAYRLAVQLLAEGNAQAIAETLLRVQDYGLLTGRVEVGVGKPRGAGE